jgi:DNA-binding NarL/FixJ family response regulator
MKADMYTIFIIDDHVAVRQGYTLLIQREPDMRVCGETASADEALHMVDNCTPDIVVLDISLQGPVDGVDLLKRLHARWPDLAILVVSGHDEMVYAQRMVHLGARGYVMKGDALMFIQALRQVAKGETYISAHVRGEDAD